MAESYEELYVRRIDGGFRKLRTRNKGTDVDAVKKDIENYINKLKKYNALLADDYEKRYMKVVKEALTKI